MILPTAIADIFGNIENPLQGGWGNLDQPGRGLIGFANSILKLLIVAGGIFTFLNILLAGLAFMSAGGDPKKIEQAVNKIWQSVIGLVIMAGSFVLAALIGWIIFGDTTAILSPKIYGPQ